MSDCAPPESKREGGLAITMHFDRNLQIRTADSFYISRHLKWTEFNNTFRGALSGEILAKPQGLFQPVVCACSWLH